jgi:prolyl oligopeptidase
MFLRRQVVGCVLALSGLAVTANPGTAQERMPKPPPTRREEVRETLHGTEITDPYRWLEDQKSPETRAWIDAQNTYTQSLLNKIPGRDAIRRRLAELVKVDTVSTPIAAGGRYFFSKRRADQELAVLYVREGLHGKDEILVDPHGMSPDKTTSVSLQAVTHDGKVMAYGVRQGGEDELSIRLMDVDRRQDLPDQLPRARYFGVALKPDHSGLYYVRHDDQGPRVYFHVLGQDPASAKEIFGKGYGPDKIIISSLSEDGRYLLLTVLYGSAAKKTEVYVQDVAAQGPFVAIVNDVEARFEGDVAGDRLFLNTNWQAPNGRILEVDLHNPGRDHWREVIPTGKSVIEGFAPVGGKLFVNYLENVISRVKIFDPAGKHLGDIAFPTLGTVSSVSGRWDRDEAFYSFTSFVVPTTIYRYSAAEGRQEEWARVKVPLDPSQFQVEQVWYESKDKTRVPMFLVHRKRVQRDGTNPTLLTGYGGFNLSRTPAFSASAAVWVEHGGVYALPNLRGGGEFGEAWHEAGMLEKKQNVFDDFIAAAEWLIAHKYTNPSRLAISGGSNGGLLVGAAMTQRPDLFRAVVCAVPLLDMIRYHKFLVARFWVPEYGSSEDPEQFRNLLAYSPYHHVRQGTKYPAVLFVSGDSDTRVAPLHARKMAALLQAATGSDRPVLLHYDTKSGHAGGKPINKVIDDATDELSFLLWQLGVTGRD